MAVLLTPSVVGIWLVTPHDGSSVAILGKDEAQFRVDKDEKLHKLPHRRDPVRITERIGGYEGQISGLITSWLGVSGQTYHDRLEAFVGYEGTRQIRLIMGKLNWPISLGEVTNSETGIPDLWVVSVGFSQVGDFSIPLVG